MVLRRAGTMVCRDASEVLEDPVESNIDVAVYDNRDTEDANTPAMREAITQVKSIAPNPAPVTTDVTIGPSQEADSTCNWQSVTIDLPEQNIWRVEILPVMKPGTHAAQQIKTCHLVSS